jgi:hypothetical protein
MRPLRAYLWVIRSETDFSVSTHRDLESLKETWLGEATLGTTVGVVHVGFTRPDTLPLIPIALRYPGRFLLTASARFALTESTTVASVQAGAVDALPIYVATSGWGYSCTADDLGLCDDDADTWTTASGNHQLPTGWLLSLADSNTLLAAAAAATGIYDESTYQTHEYRLSSADRKALGLFRLKAMGCPEPARDPLEIVRCAPPWLLRRSATSLQVSVRVSNVFANQNIVTVGDLHHITQEQLLDLQNFGRRSLLILADALRIALDEGPSSDETDPDRADSPPLLTMLRTALAEMPERSAYILRRRMGFDVPPATLQELGDELGVTRERIRQIEAKHLNDTARTFYWSKRFVQKIAKVLSQRSEPVLVHGLELLDPWFAGAVGYTHLLQFLTETFAAEHFHILNIESRLYLTALSPNEWNIAIGDAQGILENAVGQGWTEAQACQAVQVLLTGRGVELRGELWKVSSRKAHFAKVAGHESILTGYGRSIENTVEAILTESEHPLHYSEIAEKAALRLGRPVDIRRAHNAAAEVGHLYGRGTFGLLRHFSLTEPEADLVTAEAEAIIAAGQLSRQWHCLELFETILERGIDLDERLNAYIVNVALHQRSRELAYLGRLVWTYANGSVFTSAHRIDMRQAVIAILRDAGKPLTTAALKTRLVEDRGVGATFQIHPEDPLCRLGGGLWGLVDRDAPISVEEQRLISRDIIEALHKRNSGLHFSELTAVIPAVAELAIAGVEPSTIAKFAARSLPIRISTSRYLYLSSWEGPRRASLSDAVASVFDKAPPAGLTFDEIYVHTRALLGREVTRSAISTRLQSIGARWDEDSELWRKPLVDDDQPDTSAELIAAPSQAARA